ncbi:MAG: PAS domain-containing protein [Acidobacteria bacterium]|nr:PAS domain-containing protein [Acidobacteriota bacterium]
MHALLQRQLRRYLDGVDLAAAPWPAFLEAVDRSYLEAEIDRNLVETAMEISSHELLQANAELRGLVQAFPDLILHVNAEGRITSCRGRATRAFAVPTGGLVGHELRAFFRAGEQAAFDDVMVAARAPGAVVTVEHTSDDRPPAVHEMRLAAIGEGNVVAIVRDVTDARRTEDLRLAKEGAEAASRAKSAFLANMSHELRTPLNAILGYSEMLAEEAPTDMRDDLQRIHRSGRHLLQVINAMLDIARIEAGMVRIEIDAVDVNVFAAEALAAVRGAATQKGLTLDATIGAGVSVIDTDRVKLLQVLLNLLGNAVKFTEQGHVTLEVRAAEADGQPGVIFAVRDSGIGIPGEMLARLFQDFAQVDESNTRRFGGTGLGLALCRRLCGLLGGRVQVESALGAGSTFSVWVPSAGAAAIDRAGTPLEQARGAA